MFNKKFTGIKLFTLTAALCLGTIFASSAEDIWKYNKDTDTWYFYRKISEDEINAKAEKIEKKLEEKTKKPEKSKWEMTAAERNALRKKSEFEHGPGKVIEEKKAEEKQQAKLDKLKNNPEGIYTGFVDTNEGRYYIENSVMQKGWRAVDKEFYYFGNDGKLAKDQWVGNFYLGKDGKVLKNTTVKTLESNDGNIFTALNDAELAAIIEREKPENLKKGNDGKPLVNEISLYKNGSIIRNGEPVEVLEFNVEKYLEVYKAHPNVKAIFEGKDGSGPSMLQEEYNGHKWICYKAMKLYEIKEDGSIGAEMYCGDGCFTTDVSIDRKNGDKIEATNASSLIKNMYFNADRIYLDPAGYIYKTVLKKD